MCLTSFNQNLLLLHLLHVCSAQVEVDLLAVAFLILTLRFSTGALCSLHPCLHSHRLLSLTHKLSGSGERPLAS